MGPAEKYSSSAQALHVSGAGHQPAGSQWERSSSLPAISSANMLKINLDMKVRLQGKVQEGKQEEKHLYEVRRFRSEA